MDLFDKPNEKKEFLEDGSVIINLKSNSKYKITVNRNIIKVEQLGALNAINRGLVGEKLYNLDTVTGTQIKEPGMTTGYFVIQTPGTPDIHGGVQKAIKDENSILFTQSESDLIHELKDYIEYYLIHKEPPKRNIQPVRTVDDFTFDIPTETVFTSNQPVRQQPRTTASPKQVKKKPNGCAIGCLTVIGIIAVLFIFTMLFGGGNSDSDTSNQTTATENAEVEDYIRKANTYYAESAAAMHAFSELTNADNYEENRENLMHQTSDLQQRVQTELNKIPEDTTDAGLQLARQALDTDNNICLAIYATLATNDPSGADMISQYIQQYNDLKPQLDTYLNN